MGASSLVIGRESFCGLGNAYFKEVLRKRKDFRKKFFSFLSSEAHFNEYGLRNPEGT